MPRYKLRTLLIVIAATALFFGGYRLGLQHGRNGRFDDLVRQILKTNKPDSWEGVGGPGDDPFASPPSANPGDIDPFATPK